MARNPLAYPLAPVFGFGVGGAGSSGLLAVVAVIGIIAAVLVPNLLDAIQRAKQKRTMSDLRGVGTAIESYTVDKGHPPAVESMEELRAELVPHYVKSMPAMDAWETPFKYYVWQADQASAAVDSYALISAGSDKTWEQEDLSRYQAGATTAPTADVIYYNGKFFRYPEGQQ